MATFALYVIGVSPVLHVFLILFFCSFASLQLGLSDRLRVFVSSEVDVALVHLTNVAAGTFVADFQVTRVGAYLVRFFPSRCDLPLS